VRPYDVRSRRSQSSEFPSIFSCTHESDGGRVDDCLVTGAPDLYVLAGQAPIVASPPRRRSGHQKGLPGGVPSGASFAENETASEEVRAEFKALVEQCRTALRDQAGEIGEGQLGARRQWLSTLIISTKL